MFDANSNYIWQMVDNTARDMCNDTDNVITFEPKCMSTFLSVYHDLKDEYSKLKTSDLPIHRHEDAACLVVAIQRIKPLKINSAAIKTTIPLLATLPNELLSIFVALSYIKKQIRHIYTHEKDSERLYRYSKESIDNFLECGFSFPSTCCIAHKNYILWLAKAISMGSSDKFMLYSIANILFLLEAYSFQQNISTSGKQS